MTTPAAEKQRYPNLYKPVKTGCHLSLSRTFFIAFVVWNTYWFFGFYVMLLTTYDLAQNLRAQQRTRGSPFAFDNKNGYLSSNSTSTSSSDQPSQEREFVFAFTIRDARRLVPNDPPPGMHIYDYVNVYGNDQDKGSAQLFLDGHYVAEPPCQQYSLSCYSNKILQVFPHALNSTQAEFFFYMESDNQLCVPLRDIQALAKRHCRYFVGTGVGASGWLMRRDFMVDYIERYSAKVTKKTASNKVEIRPDVVASDMLAELGMWSVTNRYLVSHGILPTKGSEGLTQNSMTIKSLQKHLPRCLEPHRGKWIRPPILTGNNKHTSRTTPPKDQQQDMYGWDYFDYEECPSSEIFPCQEDVVLPKQVNISRISASSDGDDDNNNNNNDDGTTNNTDTYFDTDTGKVVNTKKNRPMPLPQLKAAFQDDATRNNEEVESWLLQHTTERQQGDQQVMQRLARKHGTRYPS